MPLIHPILRFTGIQEKYVSGLQTPRRRTWKRVRTIADAREILRHRELGMRVPMDLEAIILLRVLLCFREVLEIEAGEKQNRLLVGV